jgi:O-antigen/teichoic acid export membrane protein
LNLNILQVKGRSDLFLKLEIIKKIIAIIPIGLGIFMGIKTMLWGNVFISVFAFFLNSRYSASLINYSTREQLKDILPSFVISFCIAICLWAIRLLFSSDYLILLLQCLFGMVLMIFICEKIRLYEYLEIKQMIFSMVKRDKI